MGQMTAHLSKDQIAKYRERSLASAELLDISEHLAGCEECRARIAAPLELASSVRILKAGLQADPASAHLSYEELEAYVDGTRTRRDQAAVKAHTRSCRSCAADLEELQALRRELSAAAPARKQEGRRREFWTTLLGWRGGLVLAGAAACAVLAVVLVRTPASRNSTVARVNPPTAPAASGSGIRDGARVIALAGGGIQGLDRLGEPYRAVVERALTEKRIEPAVSLADLAANRGVLLGAPGTPDRGKLLEPLGTVVEDQRPTLRWQPLAAATYRVSVYDSAYNVVAGSGWLSAPEWQVPKPLPRGMRYSWQLDIRQNGAEFLVPVPPAPEARFRILATADEAEIARARSEWGDSHLVLGLLYARAGLLQEAEQELQALRQQNPQSEEVAGLLASVEQLRAGAPQ